MYTTSAASPSRTTSRRHRTRRCSLAEGVHERGQQKMARHFSVAYKVRPVLVEHGFRPDQGTLFEVRSGVPPAWPWLVGQAEMAGHFLAWKNWRLPVALRCAPRCKRFCQRSGAFSQSGSREGRELLKWPSDGAPAPRGCDEERTAHRHFRGRARAGEPRGAEGGATPTRWWRAASR